MLTSPLRAYRASGCTVWCCASGMFAIAAAGCAQKRGTHPGSDGSPRTSGTTEKCAIIPIAWCSRMWRWYIHSPGRSSGSQAILVWLFRGTLTVSFHAISEVSCRSAERPGRRSRGYGTDGPWLASRSRAPTTSKLTDPDGVGALVMALVHERLEADRPRRLGVRVHERVDLPQRRWNLRGAKRDRAPAS